MLIILWALLGKVSCFSDKNFERKKDTQKHNNILHQHSIQKIVLGQEKMGKCLCFVSLNSPFRFLPCFSQIGSPPPPNTTCTHNYVVCLKIWSLLRLYSTVKVIGCKSCGELFLLVLVYDRNHYFGLGPIPKPKPKLADTFGPYCNQY